jgi:hypothetical protein
VLRSQRPNKRRASIRPTLECPVHPDCHACREHLATKHRERSETQRQGNGLCETAFHQKAIEVGSRMQRGASDGLITWTSAGCGEPGSECRSGRFEKGIESWIEQVCQPLAIVGGKK